MSGTRETNGEPASGRQEGDRGLDPDLPRLLGGRLCLDFANTVEDRTGDRPEDTLDDYADLARWGRHVGALHAEQVQALLEEAARRPEAARAALARAIALREAIYRVFRAVAHGERRPEADLETVREAYLAALARARLVEHDDGIGWAWVDDGDLERVTWPVARSAIELLTGPDLRRVKQCLGDGCGWLFLDASKNRSRRWCSMAGCGSQAKMQRRYARSKAPGRM